MELSHKLSRLVLVILALVTSGAVGFHYFEHWNWLDSFYAAVITLGTVGYGDFVPHDPVGKLYAIGLVMVGLGIISYTAVELTAFVVEGHLNRLLKLRTVDNMIRKVSGHYIVCGAGRTGRHIVAELSKNKVPFVVIDRSAEQLAQGDVHSHPHLTGDATDDAILLRAGIKKAKALAATLETDEANLFLILTAKNLNPDLRIVTKVVNEPARPKLMRAGADAVVAPNFIGGLRIASEMLRPNVVSFLDTMLRSSGGERFEEASLPAGSPHAGKALGALKLPERFGLQPVAIRLAGKEFLYNPPHGHVLRPGDSLVVISAPAKLKKLRAFLQGV